MAQFTRQTGLYKAIVIDNVDPSGLNRIKVRILEIHGLSDPSAYGALIRGTAQRVMWVDDDHLPWAEVCYPYGQITPPEINQVVWVTFYGGNSQFPVIVGWAGYEYTQKEEVYK